MGLMPRRVEWRVKKAGEAWVADVKPCVSCSDAHPQAEIVLRDGSVYYKCARNGSIIFMRPQKEKA